MALVAGEHMLIVGPPGTAKSALVRHLARLVDARYFEYLLTRFSEPNELFGPVDIKAFREGSYVRRTEAMLPEAEIVFLDEIFKSNSAILNSLLSVLNERRFFTGSASIKVPLSSLYGATNEIPNDEELAAMFDRFLVRALSDNLDSYHFHGLIERGCAARSRPWRRTVAGGAAAVEGAARPLVSLAEMRPLHARLAQLLQFPEEFLARYKGLVFQIRSEGITVSDRRVVKLLKLFAASAVFDGRPGQRRRLLRPAPHLEQRRSGPAPRGHREPGARALPPRPPRGARRRPSARDLDGMLAELGVIRSLLLGGEPLSDVQLFSQLRNLRRSGRAAALGTETARQMAGEVDKLLEASSSRRSGADRGRLAARGGGQLGLRSRRRRGARAAARVLDAGRSRRARRRGRGGARARRACTRWIRRSSAP